MLWLIVPWLALPLTLAWRMLREERPPTLRDALRAFVPPPAFAWLAGMWLSALGNTLLARTAGAAHDLHSPSIAVLTVPLTVLLARSSRPPSWPLVCLGVLPMCVPLPKTMGSLNFGIALSCLAIYGLLTSAAARDLLRSLSASTWQRLLPPMLILGLEFQVRYREAGASLIDAAVLLVVLCGVVRVRRLVAIGAILVVAVLAALAQGWDLDGVLVFDCVTPVTGILLLEWSRRLSALDWDLRALSSGRAGARRGLAWTACAGIGLLACAWGENAIGMALCGVKLNYMLTKEVWGPDAATLLAFASFAFGIAFERFSIGRRERMTGAPGLAMVISYTLLSPPWFAALVALVPVAFVVAGATSNLVAGWLVLMILVPALFGPLGRTAARWLERDGADVLQSLRAPQPAPRGWRAWLPTAGVLAPAFLMVTALLECAPVAAALGATTAATLARGTGALCLASGVLALARLARIGTRMGRWKDPTLHAAAAVVLVASWSAQPLAVLRPERPQSQADTPASPVPAPGAGLAAIGAAINAAAAASSVSAASLPTDAASGPASAPSAEELEARAKAARILKDLLKPAATAPSAASMPTPRQAVPLLPAPNAPFNPAVQYASPVRPGVREIRTGPISVGRTGAFGPTTTVCAPLPPAGWKITDTSVKLSGDRECGRGSTCEIVVVDNGQTCAHFALQGSIEPPDKVPTFGMLRYRLDDNGNYEPMKN